MLYYIKKNQISILRIVHILNDTHKGILFYLQHLFLSQIPKLVFFLKRQIPTVPRDIKYCNDIHYLLLFF
jgi:hypothetical protein